MAVSNELESNYIFKRGEFTNNIENFFKLYDEICSKLQSDNELKNMLSSVITDTCYPDSELKTLTIDVGYFISKHYTNLAPNFWKISHGTDCISDLEVKNFEEKGVIVVHKDTPAKAKSKVSQGEDFIKNIKKGDYFYLCRGNSIRLLGCISSDEVRDNKDKNDGWCERDYIIIAKSSDVSPYTGNQKWWTPNDNSTCICIQNTELSLFEDYILIPYFNTTVNNLLQNVESNKKYTKEKIGNFTANVATTAKINAMKAARILGVPFALIKDLTDGEDISFSTLELLKMTDWKKVKKDYDKKHEKSNKKIEKYKKQINAHGETIKDKAKIRSEYRELLAERRRRNSINDNIRNERISAEDIKRKLRRIHYLDINANSLDKIVKKQMAELNIENKEDLTTTKINLILDRVIEKSKMDYHERQAALEKLSRNRFVDSENNEEQNDENNNSSRRPDNVIVISQTAVAINRQNIEQNQELRHIDSNEEATNNETINNNQTINDVNQETQPSNRRENNEQRIDVNDISEARAKREGSRYIAEELSRILTSVIAEDENIAKIGNSINTLKDSNEKRKSKLNVNKFIDNL